MTYRWLLPEYIEDILPAEAWRIERMRRELLELYRRQGYQLVMPPLLEYVESLLTGTGHDMDLATFRLVDQLSGRHMGLRADITPQAARIDAHLMNRQGVNRLCYAGSILRTLPDGLMRTREPLQTGAELFGHAGLEGDIEIQRLMLESLAVAGVGRVLLDIGHVGIFRALSRRAGLAEEAETDLFRALQSKDVPLVRELTRGLPGDDGALQRLAELNGGPAVLARARTELPADPEVVRALDDLETLAQTLAGRAELSFDLAELRGYRYHSGIVFAAYAHGWPDAVAKGGRYDEVGRTFGRARAATGFSMDLREIAAGLSAPEAQGAVLAPHAASDPTLDDAVAALRRAGEIVIVELPGHEAHRAELGCDRCLAKRDGRWQVVPIQPA